ncbi:hypothetical protein [Paraburkholderia kururiensis]|uniref:hypothetical protein n=1 Tax=Paraburkholderia kururiensis TaxID=984307 RepID=UPI0005A83395|nr:hypothetical protein [Paraburkholderia kururiensis]
MTALFRDSDEALKFAFRVEQKSQHAINGYGAVRGGGELSPHELRAQAVFIRKAVQELPVHLRGYAWAAYAWDESQIDGQRDVERHIAKQIGNDSAQLVELLVRRFLELGDETRPTHRAIAKQLNLHHSTVQHWDAKVYAAMTDLERALFDRLDRYFARIKLIPAPQAA